MAKVNVRSIIALVRDEFRRYGYRADSYDITGVSDNAHRWVVKFKEEPATGQAAFSQKKVQCSFWVWLIGKDPQILELGQVEMFKVDGDESLSLELCVNYKHWDLGANGKSHCYKLTAHSRLQADDPEVPVGEIDLRRE